MPPPIDLFFQEHRRNLKLSLRMTHLLFLCGYRGYVSYLHLMPHSSTVCALVLRSSYGSHFLDHLAADGTGLARGEIAVVALLEVDANLPWCTPVILKCPFTHTLRYDEGKGAMRIAM